MRFCTPVLSSRIKWLILIYVSLIPYTAESKNKIIVVADSLTHLPLANASIFDRDGKFVGTSNPRGGIVCVSANDYPITVRYMGFKEKNVCNTSVDTIFLQEYVMQLPEVTVESKSKKMLHILAYAREYSTLSTYTDTVTLFREKMMDFMLPAYRDMKYKGWKYPRTLNSKSYYHFTDDSGLDSVSDMCRYHFTWSDWVGIVPEVELPRAISGMESGTDTLSGKYSPSEIWIKNGDRVTLEINIMADTASRKWMPSFASFFKGDVDFERFRIRINYNDVMDDIVHPADLTGYSFNIESNGRGHDMFHFNHVDEPFYVTTYTEVYILDRDYISIKEAKKWENIKFGSDEIKIIEPLEAPELQQSVLALIDRVNKVDKDKIRLNVEPDRRLIGRNVVKRSMGYRALGLLKTLTGISSARAKKNWNRQWNEFKLEQLKRNNR